MSEWFEVASEIRPADAANRGFQYGDGLFETVAVRGGKARLWRYHIDRLARGCARLGLAPPPATLERDLERVLQRCQLDLARCIAKIIVCAADTDRGYGREMPSRAAVFIGVFPSSPVNKQEYVSGVSTMLCETRLATGSPMAGLKSLNRLEQVLARSECLRAGVFEGFTRDADDRLICGTISNMFIVQDRTVCTPSLVRCGVEGTMRQLVIDLLDHDGTVVQVRDLTEDDLAAADEVFITNSQIGALPVRRCGSYAWSVGEGTRRVMGLLADSGIEECQA